MDWRSLGTNVADPPTITAEDRRQTASPDGHESLADQLTVRLAFFNDYINHTLTTVSAVYIASTTTLRMDQTAQRADLGRRTWT